MPRILVTGSEGCIGSALVPALRRQGHTAIRYDLLLRTDILDEDAFAEAMAGCAGVIHLAAVSRVHLAELDPVHCHQTNVLGTASVLAVAGHLDLRPWVLLASSREVYGQATLLPVRESAPLAPLNTYARSKVAAEELLNGSVLRTLAVRLTNVYGSATDHPGRFVPALCRRALEGLPLYVRGPERTFDFLHLDDAVAGVLAAVEALLDGRRLPPVNLASGRGASLGQVANTIRRLSGSDSPVHPTPSEAHEVTRFVGDTARARHLLGWMPRVSMEAGIQQLLSQLAAQETSCAS